MNTYDAVIIGAGSAGIAAAMTLGRSRRTTLLADAGAPRNAPAKAMHNFPGHDGQPPLEFRAEALEQALAYPDLSLKKAEVTGIVVDGLGFRVRFGDGDIAARRVLFATGLKDILPDFAVLKEEWGKKSFHCPYCHGYETGGQRVAVLGGDAHRFRLALLMSRHAGRLVWCPGQAPDVQQTAVLNKARVSVVASPLVDVERHGEALRLVFANGAHEDVDQVLVNNEQVPVNGLAEDLGLALNSSGLIRIDEFQKTSMPGVFAAGDCAHRETMPGPVSAVIMAGALGMLAGAMIDQDLLVADFGLD
jgi:thioredoxin reductase